MNHYDYETTNQQAQFSENNNSYNHDNNFNSNYSHNSNYNNHNSGYNNNYNSQHDHNKGEWHNSQSQQVQINEKPKHPLLSAYSAVNWIDFGLMMFYIAYFVGIQALEFLMIPGIVLLVGITSVAASFAGIIIAIAIFAKKLNKSKGRLVARCIMWGIWIMLGIAYLVWLLA